MYIAEVIKHLERRCKERGLRFAVRPPTDEERLTHTERRLGVHFPEQLKTFYHHYNGLKIDTPYLAILSLDELEFTEPNLLHFAIIDHDHRLSFDTSCLNNAGQWNIVANESGY